MKLSLSTEWLFFHIWKKNPDTNLSCPGVFVADTVIYRWAQPYFWYFTAKDGQILRKTKERIFVEQIDEIFQKSGDVTALYLQSQQNKIIFEYFQKDDFKAFLHQREKAVNALLQKFIEPKNGKNSMIKVSWSPQFCLLSRKTNIHDLKNNKVLIEDRLVTFEGPEHLSTTDSIASPILSADIEQICLNIVKHIQDVSGGNIQISRMVLFFKIDEKNRLWLLFSSGVKVRQKFINEETGLDLPKHKDRILSPLMIIQPQPKHGQDIKFNVDPQGYVEQNKILQCNNCGKQEDLYELSIRSYVESYDAGVMDEESLVIRQKVSKNPVKKSENENDYYVEGSLHIPGLLLKMFGKMEKEKYLNLRNNQSFMNLKMKFCSECYLKFTDIQIESKLVRDTKEQIKQKMTNWQQPIRKVNLQESATLGSSTKQMNPSSLSNLQIVKHSTPLLRPQTQQIQQKITEEEHQEQHIINVKPPSQQSDKERQTAFPSKRVALIYNNKQGVQLPSTPSYSLNTTKSTITHSQRIQSIQQLKEILSNEQI